MAKRIGKLLAVIATFILCIACIAGCDASPDDADAPAKNRAYMSQANTAMMQLNKDLDPFSEAVAAGDIVSMERAATAASRDIDAFMAIEPPETMKDIHAEYCAGCDELRQALQAYVQLYREADDLDEAAFNERVYVIQAQYNSGIDHLTKGDKLVTELPGALPEESESSAASSTKAAEASSSSSSEESASEATTSSAAAEEPASQTREAAAEPAADENAVDEGAEFTGEEAEDEEPSEEEAE